MHIPDMVSTKRRGRTLLNTWNAKTIKGEKAGYLTGILYLAPHTMVAKRSLCPHSTPACRAGCLFGAGRGAWSTVKAARERKTRWWIDNPATFMDQLAQEIDELAELAARSGLKAVIRLNGTSDVLWEREGWRNASSLMRAFPDVIFYDFTKIPLEHRAPPPNYHLVFSMADDNAALALRYLRDGHSVSVVVSKETKADLLGSIVYPQFFIQKWRGHDVDTVRFDIVDGDTDDLRFLDKPSSLILLSPKGRAVLDTALVRANPLEDLMGAM